MNKNEVGVASGTCRDHEGCIQVLEVRPEWKETTLKTRCRWEDNIKVGLREVGWVAWTELIWLRVRASSGRL
jgi:hypothetical protein